MNPAPPSTRSHRAAPELPPASGREKWPLVLGLIVALGGIALTLWAWRAEQRAARERFEQHFYASSHELIGRVDSDVQTAFGVLRLLVLDPALASEDPQNWRQRLRQADLPRLGLPLLGLARVPYSAGEAVRLDWFDPGGNSLEAPHLAEADVQRALALAMVRGSTILAQPARGPGQPARAWLALRNESQILLLGIDAQRWLAARTAMLGEDFALRLSDAGEREIAQAGDADPAPLLREVGFVVRGDQHWAFEITPTRHNQLAEQAPLALLPGLFASVMSGLVIGLLGWRSLAAEYRARQAAERLRSSEGRYARVLDSTEEGIWEFPRETGRCLLSPGSLRLLDLPPREAGYSVHVLLTRVMVADRHALVVRLRALTALQRPLDCECRVISADGRLLWLRVKARVPAPGDDWVGTLADVTLQRQAAERIERYQAFLSRVLDAVPVPVVVRDRARRIVLANQAFAAAAGVVREDLGKRALAELMPQVGERLDKLDTLALETLGETELSDWVSLPGGKQSFLRMVRSACMGPEGMAVVVGSYIDLSAQAQAARDQAQARGFLQRLLDVLPDAVLVQNSAGGVLLANPAYEALSGRKVALAGLSALMSESEAAEYECEGQQVLAGTASEAARDRVVRLKSPLGSRVLRCLRTASHDISGAPVLVTVLSDVTELSGAREAEILLRSRLDSLYLAAPLGLALRDTRRGYVQLNPAFCALLGRPEAELLGLDFAAISAPGSAAADAQIQQDLERQGYSRPVDKAYLHADGHPVAVRVTVVRVTAGEGNGEACLEWSIVEDISERVQAQQALMLAERRWQFALSGSGDGVWDWDLRSGQVYYSPQWQRMLGLEGLSAQSALEEFSARLHGDDAEGAMIEIERHLAGESASFNFEARLQRADGSWCWTLNRGQVVERAADGTPLRLIATQTDISELKAVQTTLLRGREQLEAIARLQENFIAAPFSSQPFDALLADLLQRSESRYGFIGEIFYEGEAHLPGLRIFAVADLAWAEATRRLYRESLLQGLELRANAGLLDTLLREGATLIHNAPLAANGNGNGLPPGHPPLDNFCAMPASYGSQRVGIVAVANRAGAYEPALVAELEPSLRALASIIVARRSELARQRVEAELKRHRDSLSELIREQTADLVAARDAAEAASEAKSSFLANMSHELRTPLHAVLSFARLGEARVGKVEANKLRDYFSRVVHGAERLLGLLNDLLDLAKLEAGQMSLNPTATDLAALLPEVAREYEAWLTAKRQSLKIQLAPSLPAAWADPQRIGQVLRNLLSNAIKFTPEGGRIQLSLALQTDAAGLAQGVELRVADSGVGIPEGELEQVFDKFMQSSRTRTGAGGTGLGLAICREIVVGHGGEISAHNNSDGGAEFIVRLPLASRFEEYGQL